MRGHMHRLGWAEPWLFQDVIFPLLQSDRASTDDACEIWIQELGAMLEPELGHRLFDRAREGQTTNITAFLFAYSGPERQLASLKSIKAILKRQQPILQQLLASTSDWSRWDDALLVSMWILTFARWGEYYLRKRDSRNLEIEELSWSAHDFAMRRPMNEWRLSGGSRCSELAAFLDQVDELLASTKRPGS